MSNRAIVDFKKKLSGLVHARVTAMVDPRPYPETPMHDDNFLHFELVDDDHQSLIATLEAIWPNWIDGKMWNNKYL